MLHCFFISCDLELHVNVYSREGLFEDVAIAKCILETEFPKEQKALGRQVHNFDVDVWNENCKRIVREGNIAKVRH